MSGKGPSPYRRFPEVGRQTQRRDSCPGPAGRGNTPPPPQPGQAAGPVLLEGWGRARWGSRREGGAAGWRGGKGEAAGRQVLAGRRPGQGTSGEGWAPRALDGCRSDHLSLINEAVQRGLLMRTRGLSQPGGSCWNSKGTAGKLSPLLRHSRSEGSGPSPGREGAGRPVPQGGCAQPGVSQPPGLPTAHTAWGPLAVFLSGGTRPGGQSEAGRTRPQTCRVET